MFTAPVAVALWLLRLTPGGFGVETTEFVAYRVIPASLCLASLWLGVCWVFMRRPPRLTTLTFAMAAVFHGLAGLFFFPQTYSILVPPLAVWSGVVYLMIGRIDWVEVAFLGNRRDGPYWFGGRPDSRGEAAASDSEIDESEGGPPSPTIEERFQRLREQLRPQPQERIAPRPSPFFLGTLALIGGVVSCVVFLPSAPGTLPLYGVQSEGFEAEPLWDPLLLAPRTQPRESVASPGDEAISRIWFPRRREADLPEAWERAMDTDAVRVIFSKRSALIRVESEDCVAIVNPLMELAEASADGFALVPWNRASLTAGSATGWQEWTADGWTTWVRYSGDPLLSGSWPTKTRRGIGPWIGKVAMQIVPDRAVVGMASVNRLNLGVNAREADLCHLTIEPIREAVVRWGTTPPIQDFLTERSQAWLHRTAPSFIRQGVTIGPGASLVPLREETRSRFHGWLIVRQPGNGPGFLIFAPYWHRQIGIERPTDATVGDPTNSLSVSVEGLTTRVRFSLMSATCPTGSTVATVAPGTYLNSLFLVPIRSGESNEEALRRLGLVLRDYAPPMLFQETRDLIPEN